MRRVTQLLLASWVVACGVKGPQGSIGGEATTGPGGAGSTTVVTVSGASTAMSSSSATGTGGAGGEPPPQGGNGQPPPLEPVWRIPLRVHVGESKLPDNELIEVLKEINWIWWSQAAVCFEMEVVEHDDNQQVGFDIRFVTDLGNVNGYYAGDHDVWTIDYPSLGSAPNPTKHPASRTAAHEFGHGLTLKHYNGFSDSNDSLMSSGRKGWKIHDFEIDGARGRAEKMALEDISKIYCAEPTLPSP